MVLIFISLSIIIYGDMRIDIFGISPPIVQNFDWLRGRSHTRLTICEKIKKMALIIDWWHLNVGASGFWCICQYKNALFLMLHFYEELKG